MIDYMQFCTVARGAEVLGELWTPLVVRERPMVRTHELFTRLFIETLRQALAQAAAVHEHDRARVLPHQLRELGHERGPDAGRAGAAPARRG